MAHGHGASSGQRTQRQSTTPRSIPSAAGLKLPKFTKNTPKPSRTALHLYEDSFNLRGLGTGGFPRYRVGQLNNWPPRTEIPTGELKSSLSQFHAPVFPDDAPNPVVS